MFEAFRKDSPFLRRSKRIGRRLGSLCRSPCVAVKKIWPLCVLIRGMSERNFHLHIFSIHLKIKHLFLFLFFVPTEAQTDMET